MVSQLLCLGRAVAAAAPLAVLSLPLPALGKGDGEARSLEPPAVAAPRPAMTDAAPDPLSAEDLDFGEAELPPDPFEPANRKLFAFNQGVERFVLDPMVRGYRFLVPEPARRSLRRAFENLNAPVIVVNDVLQGRFEDAAEAVGCFALNSTVGWAGLFDAAGEMGWEMRPADFGQTLARIGVGSGPYLVLPILGPSTVRDGFGDVVDQLFHPLSYVLGPGATWYLTGMVGGGTGLAKLDEARDQLQALRESSVDFYAALRSAYLQHRTAQLRAE
jgi:phospholipid-binding lipoprotein MlaA